MEIFVAALLPAALWLADVLLTQHEQSPEAKREREAHYRRLEAWYRVPEKPVREIDDPRYN